MNTLDNAFNDFGSQLYAELVNTMPVDTGNMINHTFMRVSDDEIQIVITAPTSKGYDYAYDVNENRQRGEKEKRNYHYVQRCIERAMQIISQKYGGVINGKIQ